MKIGVVGTGYVGLVTGTCFAEMGNEVTCVDIDQTKVENLKKGILPIYEPGLEEMVKRNAKEQRLFFTTDIREATLACEILFIAVGTPPGEDGSADLQYVVQVARDIATTMDDYRVIVNKSTVPVGTGDLVAQEVSRVLQERRVELDFDVVSNPEFLKEGAAIDDFMKPDRIVVGVSSERAQDLMQRLYEPFVRSGRPVLFMDVHSSEMTKYAANAMLATKISFMNEVARLCERVGADIEKVRKGIGSDSRIGHHFIYPGLGYGGSCFPKDVKALLKTGHAQGEPMHILDAVETVNQAQRQHYIQKLEKRFQGALSGKRIALWGLAFKPGTDDIREAPALDIIEHLLKKGATVAAFDPVAAEHVRKHFGQKDDRLTFVENQYDALVGADALCLVTEWKQFREPNFKRMKSLMKSPVLFDGRNQYDLETMKTHGFEYYSIGR